LLIDGHSTVLQFSQADDKSADTVAFDGGGDVGDALLHGLAPPLQNGALTEDFLLL
jgi:hypothetical protein